MNIFVLDESPSIAARMLCDCHLRKMCVETAQILSGVMLRRGMTLLDGMPKPQNINHPVIVAAEDITNTEWVAEYNWALQSEYYYAFGKEHKYSTLVNAYYERFGNPFAKETPENLAICCGDLDISGLDIVLAYRKYYIEVKKPQLQSKGLWHFTNRKDWTE